MVTTYICSYGMVLWELVTKGEPYKGLTQANIIAGVTGQGTACSLMLHIFNLHSVI